MAASKKNTLTLDEAQMLLNDHLGDTAVVQLDRVSRDEDSFPLLMVRGELRAAMDVFHRGGVGADPDTSDQLSTVYCVGDLVDNAIDFAQLRTAPLTITADESGLQVWLTYDVFLRVTWHSRDIEEGE